MQEIDRKLRRPTCAVGRPLFAIVIDRALAIDFALRVGRCDRQVLDRDAPVGVDPDLGEHVARNDQRPQHPAFDGQSALAVTLGKPVGQFAQPFGRLVFLEPLRKGSQRFASRVAADHFAVLQPDLIALRRVDLSDVVDHGSRHSVLASRKEIE